MVPAASTNEEKVPVTIDPRTASGNPAGFDGAIQLTIQDGDATAELDPANQKRFFVVSGPNPGVSHIMFSIDADLGAGVRTLSEVVEYTVNGAEAVSLNVSVGTPEPK